MFCKFAGRWPWLPQGSGLKPRSNTRLSSLNRYFQRMLKAFPPMGSFFKHTKGIWGGKGGLALTPAKLFRLTDHLRERQSKSVSEGFGYFQTWVAE